MICVLFTGSTSALAYEIGCWVSLVTPMTTQEGERNEAGVHNSRVGNAQEGPVDCGQSPF